MTTKNIFIGPEKFTIFDSDISDSESESDEWVSVSTSTTVSTTSTLPSHLNLNPRSAIKTRPQPLECGAPRPPNSTALSSPISSSPAAQSPPPPAPPLPPSTTAAAITATKPLTSPNQVSRLTIPTQPSVPREPPITFLKRFFPTLTAIYVVSPASIYPSTSIGQEPTTPNTHIPLSTLTNLQPHPPVSTKATRPNANSMERYLRICADCAKPPVTIFCDGTWTGPVSVPSQPCKIHRPAFASNASAISMSNQLPGGSPTYTCSKCTHMTQILTCRDCASKRDHALFHAVMDAVSPFRRVETRSLGVDVFDMSVPVAGEVYHHAKGCGCQR